MMRHRSVLVRYGLALLFTVGATGARLALDPVLLESPGSMLFVLAILAASYFGGIGPSLFSAALSGVAITLLWIEPRFGLQMHLIEWTHLALLLLTAVAINTVTEMLVRARVQAAEQAGRIQSLAATLEERVAERTAVAERRAVQLRLLNAQLVQTERRERRRLAQMLHDHLQQQLVAVKIQLGAALRRMGDGEESRTLQIADELISDAIHASRTLTFELRPPVLDHGLAPALDWLARSMQDKHHLRVTLSLDHDAEPEAEDVRAFLFETVRELLFNVVKHANVAAARVTMKRVDGHVELSVEDEGVGFDPAAMEEAVDSGEHFGLFNVRERLDAIGGSMNIQSTPGRGARVTLTAALSDNANSEHQKAAVHSWTAARNHDR